MKFEVEWQSAPGVRDPILANTWARLTITTGTADLALTSAIDLETRQARAGIFGSVFPLARWVLDNFWSLLWEAPKSPLKSGRELSRIEDLRSWVQRHNLLTAREGFSLPDLSIARDGDWTVVAVFPDGVAAERSHRPIAFVADGVVRVNPRQLQDEFLRFLRSVSDKIIEFDHPDAWNFREDLTLLTASIAEEALGEAERCESAGRLGLDPLDPEEFTDELIAILADGASKLPTQLRTDLLDSLSAPTDLKKGVAWIDKAAHLAGEVSLTSPQGGSTSAVSAHETGYRRARELRKQLGLSAADVDAFVHVSDDLGFGLSETVLSEPPAGIDAFVAVNARTLKPRIVGPELPHESQMFRWARALYLWRADALTSPRLLASSHGRIQREGRAFAAELLAPAAALKDRLKKTRAKGVVSGRQVENIAKELGLSPLLIRHQVENHGLGIVTDD